MPRRTVQEVTVQDVQKRRNPNKHYVRRLQNLSVSLGFFFSSFSCRTEEKQREDQITAEPGGNRRLAAWLVWSLVQDGE